MKKRPGKANVQNTCRLRARRSVPALWKFFIPRLSKSYQGAECEQIVVHQILLAGAALVMVVLFAPAIWSALMGR